MLLAALGAGAIAYFIPKILCSEVAQKSEWMPSFSVSLMVVGGCIWAVRHRLRAWIGISTALRYPPLWFAIMLGSSIFLELYFFGQSELGRECYDPSLTDSELRLYATCVGLTPLALISTALALQIVSRWLRPSTSKPGSPVAAAGTLSILKWLDSDEPIRDKGNDRFGLTSIVSQVVDRIQNSNESFAIIGQLGSGKSSLRELVATSLREREEIRIVRVGLWPYQSVDAAIVAILRELTQVMSEHTSTEVLTGLAEDYVGLIEEVAGPLKKLTQLGKPTSPEAQLALLDTVATALGLKLVLWVEDLERFSGSHQASDEPEYARLGPLRALLSELSSLHSVQVALATADVDRRFDLEKLARSVFAIPAPDSIELCRIITEFRAVELKGTFIDPVSSHERDRLWPDEQDLRQFSEIGLPSDAAPLRIAQLCNVPRRLKSLLRECHEAWQILRGEIDFDDLILITALRRSNPDIFALINLFINDLRQGRPADSNGKRQRTRFADTVEKHLDGRSDAESEATKWILNELFPGWDDGDRGQGRSRKHPQCLSASHLDYWARYLRLDRTQATTTDQECLATAHAWVLSDPKQRLVEQLTSATPPLGLERLTEAVVPRQKIPQLLSDLIDAEMRLNRRSWENHSPTSIRVISSFITRGRETPSELTAVLKKCVTETGKTNLGLHVGILAPFTYDGAGHVSLEDQLSLSRISHSLLSSYFKEQPQRLVSALVESDPTTLRSTIWGASRPHVPTADGFPFDGWLSIAPTILAAARERIDVMLPQLCHLLTGTQTSMDTRGSEPILRQAAVTDEDMIRRLFSASLLELRDAISNVKLDSFDTDIGERHKALTASLNLMISAAKEAADR